MKKYLSEYIKYIDDIIKNGQVTKEILDTHLIKITFFQHERLIHLLVTLFYALFTLAFLALGTIHYIFFIISREIHQSLFCKLPCQQLHGKAVDLLSWG